MMSALLRVHSLALSGACPWFSSASMGTSSLFYFLVPLLLSLAADPCPSPRLLSFRCMAGWLIFSLSDAPVV
eukprot:m.228852 g.228852  ORF g.228852 m.228852 type:complete len:72 (+) comp17611_c0_seq1:240-455(+)